MRCNASIGEIQNAILGIYSEIKRICEKHGLRYFAIGGTCIGAVRHHGFIPWDDDMDIALPVDDYYVFLKVASEELPYYFKIRTPHNTQHVTTLFSKVHDIRTTNIESFEKDYPDSYKGIFVDIMPLGGLPQGSKQKAFIKKMKCCFRNDTKVRFPLSFFHDPISKIHWIQQRPYKWLFGYDYWTRKWESLISSIPFDNSSLVGYVWSNNIRKQVIFEKKWFDAYKEMRFESTTIRVPAGYDEMLRLQFGDYMSLPPENERRIHSTNGGVIFTDQAYREYEKEKLE